MKNQISRLAALGTLAIGLLATGEGQAYFSGTSWGWPNPQIQSPSGSGHYYLGQGSVWGGSAPDYTNGWSLARYYHPGGGDDHCLTWIARYSLNSSSDVETTGGGSGCTHSGYRLVEYYWDGATYDYGESNIDGEEWTNAGCD
jgi:hypothetical protein